MKQINKKVIICPTCDKSIYSLGYASHLEKHHREEQHEQEVKKAITFLESLGYKVLKT